MDSAERAIAIVGVGAMLPDAPNAAAFWNNIVGKRYSITETPSDRWSIADYYDPDPKAPDKTYSKIGGWVRGFEFDWKRFRLPPRVAAVMDEGQQWAMTIAAEALADYGYPDRPLDTERTGVILGTAMGGEMHYITTQRIAFPEYANWLRAAPEFQRLPANTQVALMEQFHAVMDRTLPTITEDSMPGELANIVSGRIANIFNLRGPNFITDAACASSFAAVEAAVELLTEHKVDAVLTGGVDRNMGASTFVKFCKIGALSATGTRPFGVGADGFIMGEGAGAFLLKRLEDAERAGDTIYAVIRGVAGSSDGKGKGITAPNPIGQQLAVRRAWESAELDPATATLVEAHGTSTRVGDVVEVESLAMTFGGAPRGSIGLGSAKSNIGHLKAGAGAAGLLKTALALHHKILPPTLNADPANPNIDFANSPFYLVNEAREWTPRNGFPRRAGVSAYGFGGTNFHLVMEEHVPGMLTQRPKQYAGVALGRGADSLALGERVGERASSGAVVSEPATRHTPPAPPRGILSLGANTPDELKDRLDEVWKRVEAGWTPPFELPRAVDIRAKERLIIDFGDHAELVDRLQKARKVMGFDTPQAWKAMEAQGIFRGHGPKPGKLAFLFPGQGSQYVNMGRELAAFSPTVKATLDEADAIMQPILGRALSGYLFINSDDKTAVNQANFDLMQTEITQPAMLTLDEAIRRLLADYGFAPDMVMGHSLGEYGALVAAGILPFAEALEAAAGRGREMARVKMEDNGWMAAVLAPYEVVEATLHEVGGYVVPANINSNTQSVIGGESKAVEKAIKLFQERGYQAMQLPVSHAFHTRIVAPASAPLRKMLDRMNITPPRLPLVANVTGEFYPAGVTEIKDLLEKQIASPVQWVKGLQTMHAAGARVFVEVGPKRALRGFVKDVFGEQGDVVALMTNHPKNGEMPSFNQALCGLYAAGFGAEETADGRQTTARVDAQPTTNDQRLATTDPTSVLPAVGGRPSAVETDGNDMNNNPQPATGSLDALAQTLAQLLQTNGQPAPRRAYDRNETPLGSVVISGTGLGLPGANKSVMDPDNALRILRGEQFVDLIPERFRNQIVQKQITRIVKGEDGSGRFETISDPAEVIKLAGRPGPFDLSEEYGVPAELVEALDITSQLAMAAGIDALREAGIPLVQTYKRTSTGKYLPERWVLPEAMRDDTGVIFASAFPGGDRFADEFTRYYTWLGRKQQLEMLEDLRNYTADGPTLNEIARRIDDLRDQLERESYVFDRRFLFRILSMGHSQLAQYIGARGPNTQVNAACASTAQAISIAEDWIRSGRCRRVVVVGGDDVTGDHLMEWVGAGFLSVGAATTKDQVAEAALPFDRRRHGTIMGMGACALVVESEDAVRERGMRGIVELLSSETSNSAFHGTRLDVSHIAMVMESLVAAGERRFGLNRHAIAPQTVFMSHETFTPARGGSASAEVTALRHTFGESANSIIIANTKGFTGHAMGVGVEDVIAVKILEYGIVPPVPNFREVDPDLGPLNLSRGGRYPVQYAIHLGAGFGSQIALTFTRRIPGGQDRVDNKPAYRRWLADVSGYDTAETEVVKRTLRVAAQGNPPRTPAPNRWQPGTGPTVRALVSGEAAAVEFPARMVTPTADRRPPTAVPPGNGKPAAAPQPQQAAAPAPAVVAPTPAPQPAPQPVVAPAPQPQPQPVVATAQPVAAPTVPAAVGGQPSAVNPVVERVLGIVAEQTGYPLEMLDLDLDMEADLGIDTVKQAETFQAIRNAFDIPRRDDLKLRDYPTLGAVIGFVYAMRPDLAQGSGGAGEQGSQLPRPVGEGRGEGASVAEPTTRPTPPATDTVVDKVLGIVAAQTGYPLEMLELDLDMEADLGIDTVKQAETFQAIRNAFDIPRRDDLKLRDYPTLGAVIGFVYAMRPDLAEQGSGGAGERGSQLPPPVVESAATSELVTRHSSLVTSTDVVTDKVLAIVAAQTGYPLEMLELDLDMEADLGIDTVKQAETFQAIRNAFDIPRRDDLKLRDYPTLGAVIGFVYAMRPELAQGSRGAGEQGSAAVTTAKPATAAVAEPATRPTPPATPATDVVTDKVLSIVAAQTGYPLEMLELDLDMEADLGIDTVKQAETFQAIRNAFDIPRRDDLKLRDYPTLGAVIGFVYAMRPDLAQGSGGAREQGGQLPHPVGEGRGEGASVAEPATRPTPPATSTTDVVTNKVLSIVAAQTGYPLEMLELDLDMEADLGIDTVKQAETFQAIRNAFDIPRRDDLKLRDYPTLGAVIGFVYAMRPDLAQGSRGAGEQGSNGAAVQESTRPFEADSPHSPPATRYSLADADTMPRRIPVPALRPALDLCRPTGVTLNADSRVVVMLDRGGVGKALVSRLEKLGATALVIDEPPTAEALEAQLAAWLNDGPIQGVYWLPALDTEAALEEMDMAAWREANRVRVKNLYTTMRALYDAVSAPGTFLVSATRLGGLHGYGPDGATAPLGGAVAGFTKAYKRERGDALVKVVDFEAGRKTAAPADLLIAETLSDPGIVEVSYYNDARYTVTLVERPAADGGEGLTLTKDSVFLVTGAAGGITSAIIGDLAAAGGGTFYLLDLVPEPAQDDPQIALFRQGKDALKQHLIAEAKSKGEKVTPAQIDKQIMTVERNEAALRAIESVEAAGGMAYYRSVNLLDGPALAAVVEEIRERHGRIDVLVHAGGIEISRSLADKDFNQFSLVFDIKADGFFSLLNAAKGMPIGATVAFSSVAGRFGNNGQTDYSAANDLLCKLTSSLRRWRPETKGIVIDWTAWGEIGMATRGSIPRIMEMAGIDMLPPAAGVPTVRRELVAGGYHGEIVVGGRLGIMAAEWDANGGLDTEKANTWLAARQPQLLMLGQVTAAKLYGGLEVATTLDPKAQPFLYDHAMDGTPLLPGVMGTEAFGQLALALTPGYRVAAVFDEQFHAPFKFYRMEAQTLYLSGFAEPTADGLVVRAALHSRRELGQPGLPPQVKLHFTANVLLARELDTPMSDFTPPAAEALPIAADAIYRVYFHGPAYQVLERAGVAGQTAIGLMADALPPNTDPAGTASLLAPRLIELCFQTAGVWDIQTNGTMALPLGIGAVTVYRQPEEAAGQRLYALVEAVDGGESYNAQVVDEAGNVYVELKGYRTVDLPGSVSLS